MKRHAVVALLDLTDRAIHALECLAAEVACTAPDGDSLNKTYQSQRARLARVEELLGTTATSIWEARLAQRAADGRGGYHPPELAEARRRARAGAA